MAFIFGVDFVETIVFLVFLGVILLLPLIALIDVIQSEFQGPNDKLIWVLIILFLNILGVVLYLAIGRSQRVA